MNSIVVSGLSFDDGNLVALAGWAISLVLSTDRLRKPSSRLVGPPFMAVGVGKFLPSLDERLLAERRKLLNHVGAV